MWRLFVFTCLVREQDTRNIPTQLACRVNDLLTRASNHRINKGEAILFEDKIAIKNTQLGQLYQVFSMCLDLH